MVPPRQGALLGGPRRLFDLGLRWRTITTATSRITKGESAMHVFQAAQEV